MSDFPETSPIDPIVRIETGSSPSFGNRDSEIFFSAVEAMRMPMMVTDPRKPDNPILFANRAFVAMTGYAPEEVVGRNCRFLQGPETDEAVVAEIRRAIAERREYATEILNYRKDGSTFWNALFIAPVYDAANELVYFFGSQLDVSRRRDAEDALGQTRTMEAIGQLTGNIAHDFNNLLQVIVGYIDILSTAIDTPDADRGRMRRAADNIRVAAERATTLTHQLLAFARKQQPEGRAVNLNSLIQGMTDLANRTLGAGVSMELDLAADLWTCRIDPTQTEAALLNILINARDAMPGGGSVTLSTENRGVDAGDPHHPPGLAAGRHVCVSVRDTGPGIPPEVLARVMDAFFTTKAEGRSAGLGLSMVQSFAKQSGGTMQIASVPGEGTTVRLSFPASEPEDRPQPHASAGPMEGTGTETVLIVDDREDVGELARTILRDFGYATLTARNGREALAILDQTETVDLLFTDLIMPGGMNGLGLAREAQRRRPTLKVLLTTGYAEASLERTETGDAEFDLLNKPYRRTDLIRRVRSVLDGPTGID